MVQSHVAALNATVQQRDTSVSWLEGELARLESVIVNRDLEVDDWKVYFRSDATACHGAECTTAPERIRRNV